MNHPPNFKKNKHYQNPLEEIMVLFLKKVDLGFDKPVGFKNLILIKKKLSGKNKETCVFSFDRNSFYFFEIITKPYIKMA